MAAWRHLLGGMLLWTAHFFAAFGIASTLPGTRAANIIVLIATVVALGIATLLFVKTIQKLRSDSDQLTRWIYGAAALGYALAGTAILFQGLPALLA